MFFVLFTLSCLFTSSFFGFELLVPLQYILSLGLHSSSIIFFVAKFKFFPASSNVDYVSNNIDIVVPFFQGV